MRLRALLRPGATTTGDDPARRAATWMGALQAVRLSVLAAAASFVWCLLVGVLIWNSPVVSTGIEFRQDAEGTETFERVEERAFSDHSTLGVVPLVIPVLLAAWALWAARRRRTPALAVATSCLPVYCVLTGFSIGGAYMPAGLGLLVATLMEVLSRINGSWLNAIQRLGGLNDAASSATAEVRT